MKCIRANVTETEVNGVHPSNLKEAVRIAHIDEYNFKSARIGWNGNDTIFEKATFTSTW